MVLDPQGGQSRYRRSLGPDIETRHEAEDEEARLRSEFAIAQQARLTGRPVSAELPSAVFSGFARRWLDVHVKTNCRPSQLRRYGAICKNHLVPFFGDRQLTSITPLDVEEFKADNVKKRDARTGEPLAPKTVNEHLGTLSSMLSAAVRWGCLHDNPCRKVARLSVPEQDFTFYDAEQTAVFLEKAKTLEPEWFTFFLTAFRSGLRLGELFGLEWGDIDFVARRIHIQRSYHLGHATLPKGKRKRWVPMCPSLVEALKTHKHLKGNLVFCRPDGSHLTRDIVKHPFDRITFAAGLHRIRLHDMRHSFASQLVMAGVPLKFVSEMLGHTEIKMTERYTHLTPNSVQSYIGVLDGQPAPGTAQMPPWWGEGTGSAKG